MNPSHLECRDGVKRARFRSSGHEVGADPAAPPRGRILRQVGPAGGALLRIHLGTSRDRASVAQEPAAQLIGESSFELPGEPSGVERETIGQVPSAD